MVRCGVSTEALVARATAKGYEPGAHREKDAVGKKTYGDGELSYYDTPPRIRDGLPPLDLATIIDFFRFFARISEGRINENGLTTVDSVCTNGEIFFAGFARATGNLIPDEDKSAVYDCVKREFLQEKIITNGKKQKQLWGKDESG